MTIRSYGSELAGERGIATFRSGRAPRARDYGRSGGQPEFELFAEGEDRFFMRIVDAQGTFLRNKNGTVDRLLWHQGGKYQYCPRVP
jgi:D-alanyl-D-alanine-carboxypeptidase/D-alanyl-D-alanine-endopeptidase